MYYSPRTIARYFHLSCGLASIVLMMKIYGTNRKFKPITIIKSKLTCVRSCSHFVRCNIPNCEQQFDTVFAYESHYNTLHRFLCGQCSKHLPSAHLLDLHLSETHDSFFAVQAEKKPMVSVTLPLTCFSTSLNEFDFILSAVFLLFGRM